MIDTLAVSGPTYARVRYIIFDWAQVDGIDFTGAGTVYDILKNLQKHNIKILFTGIPKHSSLENKCHAEGIPKYVDYWMRHLDEAVEVCEDLLLKTSCEIMHKWLVFDSFRYKHEREKMIVRSKGV